MKKPFFLSDAILFIKDSIDSETLNQKDYTLYRDLIFIKARAGITNQEILDEVQYIEDARERSGCIPVVREILTTTLTECTDMVVVMTYDGFVKVSELRPEKLRRERYAGLVQDLIQIRDSKDYQNP